MSDRATCETCRWWERSNDDDGICRRYAPRPKTPNDVSVMEAWPVWPKTLDAEWCGEHQRREARDA